MRIWRLLVAVLFFSLCLGAYFHFGDTADLARKASLAPQVSTSVTHLGGKLVVAVILLAVTFFLGRWYCSLLCPAGMAQELFHRLGRLLGLRKPGYAPPGRPLLLLGALSLLLIAGVVAVSDFLDPIGTFGRLAVAAGDARRFSTGQDTFFTYDIVLTSAIVLGAVFLVVLPLFLGRWFCDRLCPIGALLGIVSAHRRRGVWIDADKCVSCGKCEKVCQTNCVDAAAKRLDPARCVSCLDCVGTCKFGALATGAAIPGGRRNFLRTAATAALGGVFVFSRELGRRVGVMAGDFRATVVPPGAGGYSQHRSRCVTCQACVLACPVGIIRPRPPEYLPVMDYDRGYCQYSCAACSSSCPAGVFSPITLEEKQRTRIARTELLPERCVVVTQGTACGACAEVCPTHAVSMREQGGDLPTLPDFDAEYCIGCGACYHVCPAEPRVFRLEGLESHEVSAGVRPVEHGGGAAADVPVDDEGMVDFPF